jgi:hypothetical protein
MLARRVITETEDGVSSVDYVKADVAQAEKRNWPVQLTPAQERILRDDLWKKLADEGLKPHAIAIYCARAAQSARNIRRRLREIAAENRRGEAEAS